MRALVVGATAGLGRALADGLAAEGYELLLCGREESDLRRVAADLRSRHGVDVGIVIADASSPLELHAALSAGLAGHELDIALLPVGVSVEGDAISGDPSQAFDLVRVNLVSVMTATMAVADVMRAQGHGAIVGFSSIAAARGRGQNAAYAASKRGVESWFESLRTDLAGVGVSVTLYVLGYLATNLSYGKRLPLPVASADRTAANVIRHLEHPRAKRFAPPWWRAVASLIKRMPFSVFRRMKA